MASRSIKNRKSIKKKNPFVGFLVFLVILIGFGSAAFVGVFALGSAWLKDLPDYEDVSLYNVARKTEVYANDKTTLLAEFFIENRIPITYDQISQFVIDGTIATEDDRYFEHQGIDLMGIGRALFVNMTGEEVEGASTITQQFVRSTVLSGEASDISFKRKVREMYIAIKLEEIYYKDEILLMYLNTINYGQNAYGIEAAAQTYFSKHASDLTLAEAAALVGIPQSPTYNNPVDDYDSCLERRNHVLNRMFVAHKITEDQYLDALLEPLELTMNKKSGDGIYLFPYFTSYIRDTLLEQYSTDEIFKGGLKVYTTIDPAIQAEAERAARNKEATIDDDLAVALTAVDPSNGYILAMVGGKDFYANDESAQWNLATQAKRSCGSSFKTFTLVTALEHGISPTTSISCSARASLGDWTPENYGGGDYGTRTIAGAFEVSSNTAFARLITALGPEAVIDTAHRMGIKSSLPAVRAITLGAVEVSTEEMAGAYATIANGGIYHEVTGIEYIVDATGKVIWRAKIKGERVLAPEIAYAATNVMKGVVSRGTGGAAGLWSGQPVAGKTGTSENWHDSYFVGITPQISVAIWLGAPEQRQMPASYTASSVFSDFVGAVLEGQPIVDFPQAANPTYKPYINPELNIGSGKTDEEKKKEEEEKKKKEKEEKDKQKQKDAADKEKQRQKDAAEKEKQRQKEAEEREKQKQKEAEEKQRQKEAEEREKQKQKEAEEKQKQKEAEEKAAKEKEAAEKK